MYNVSHINGQISLVLCVRPKLSSPVTYRHTDCLQSVWSQFVTRDQQVSPDLLF